MSYIVNRYNLNYDGGLSGSIDVKWFAPPPPTWTAFINNGTGTSGAKYSVDHFVDNGDFTYEYWFKKIDGSNNIDFWFRERVSDGELVALGSGYKFIGEWAPSGFNPSYHDPSLLYDGQTSHRIWVTDSETPQPTDTYIEFHHSGEGPFEPPVKPTWEVRLFERAQFSIVTFEDHGDYTYDYWFRKESGGNNIDFTYLERISDGALTQTSSGYKYVGDHLPSLFNPSTHNPAAVYDGKTSHRIWAMNGTTPTSTDSYIEFIYTGDA